MSVLESIDAVLFFLILIFVIVIGIFKFRYKFLPFINKFFEFNRLYKEEINKEKDSKDIE